MTIEEHEDGRRVRGSLAAIAPIWSVVHTDLVDVFRRTVLNIRGLDPVVPGQYFSDTRTSKKGPWGQTIGDIVSTLAQIDEVGEQLEVADETVVALKRKGDVGGERFRPLVPTSLDQAGIHSGTIEQLILKNLYFRGEVSGRELSKLLGLPFSLIEPILAHLKQDRQVEARRSAGFGTISTQFAHSEVGRARAKEYLEANKHLGPAAVPMSQYRAAVEQQRIKPGWMSQERLKQAFSGAVISEDFLSQFGPAVNSFKSMLIYGKPGNGKTFLAEQLTRIDSDPVYIPQYIEIDGQIIKLFDPLHHVRKDQPSSGVLVEEEPEYDQRWVRCNRPFLTTGGELTLAMLDLMHLEKSGIYDAPYQLKANNGIYLVDDFGRQRLSPAELLNRWIYPLDRGIDYLSFDTGTKVEVPFECFLMFSSNLNPEDLGDEAFLRRLDYKMFASNPPPDEFATIFHRFCEQSGLNSSDELVEHTLREHYEKTDRKLRRCHPRDILRAAIDLISYEDRPYVLTTDLIDRAYRMKFMSSHYANE